MAPNTQYMPVQFFLSVPALYPNFTSLRYTHSMLKKIFITTTLFIIYCMHTQVAHAQFISEIMYDAPGTDTKREWIEIYINTEINIGDIRFTENNVRHKITGDTTVIPADSYVVIASDMPTFLNDHPDVKGLVFDSVFSLSNEGESLILELYESNVDEVTYSAAEGSFDEEYSLQLIDNKWKYEPSTPGEVNKEGDSIDSPAAGSSSSGSSNSTSKTTTKISSENSQFEMSKKIHTRKVQDISIGRERIGYPQVPLSFEVITKDGLYKTDKVMWSFGDGYFDRGIQVKHAFRYPGTYVVTANIIGKTDAGISRTIVHVLKNEVVISEVSDTYIVIHNPLNSEVNIGGFYIDFTTGSRKDAFKIPANTIILPDTHLIIPFDAMILRREVNMANPVLRPPDKK